MAYRKTINAACVVALALALPACGYIFPAKYRYRMTVEVQTPQGVRTGSAVYQIEAHQKMCLTSEEHCGGGSFRGQAIVIDLPSGPLFVMMQKPDDSDPLDEHVTLSLLPDTKIYSPAEYVPAVRKLGGWWSYKADLARSDWPLIVRFKNFNDPSSIEAVDPAKIGVLRVSVKTTHDAISTGIERVFPAWFGRLYRAHAQLDGNTSNVISSARLDDELAPESFSTELGK